MDYVLNNRQYGILSSLSIATLFIDDDTPPGSVSLSEIRWQLSRQIRLYVIYKHDTVFPPLVNSDNAFIVKLARDMQYRCDAIVAEYMSFLSTWNETAVCESAVAYRTAAKRIVRSLTSHIERESVDIEQLLGLSRFPSLSGSCANVPTGCSDTNRRSERK